MRILALLCLGCVVAGCLSVSCRFVSEKPLGDTVAASVFEPVDTAALHAREQRAKKLAADMKDSVGIYLIGEGSTKEHLQLLSFPSRKDTLVYGKTRHVKVVGSAQIGTLVRVAFYVLPSGDSLVSRVEAVKLVADSVQQATPKLAK